MKRNDLYAVFHVILLLVVCVITFFLNYRTLYVKDVSYNIVMIHRLISAAAGIILTFFIYLLAKEISRRDDFAWIASLLFCSSYTIISFGRAPSADVCSYAAMMGALFFIFCTFKEKQAAWLSALLGGALLGLSYLCSQWQTYLVMLMPFLVVFVCFFCPIEWKRWRQFIVLIISWAAVVGLSYIDFDFFHTTAGQYIFGTKYLIGDITDIRLNYYYLYHLLWSAGPWSLLFLTSLLCPIWMKDLRKHRIYLAGLIGLLLQLVACMMIETNRYLLIPLVVSQSLIISSVIVSWNDTLKKRSPHIVDKLFIYNAYLLSAICALLPIAGYWMIYKSGYMMFERYLLFSIYTLIISGCLFIATWKRMPYFLVYGIVLLFLIGEVMM
jgi:hypothetical protein